MNEEFLEDQFTEALADNIIKLLRLHSGVVTLSDFPRLWAMKYGTDFNYTSLCRTSRKSQGSLRAVFAHYIAIGRLPSVHLGRRDNGAEQLVLLERSSYSEDNSVLSERNVEPQRVKRIQLLEETWCAVCFMCDEPFLHPICTRCAHVLCKECLTVHLKKLRRGGDRQDLYCPECHAKWEIHSTDVRYITSASRGLYKQLYEQLVKPRIRCVKNGCQWTGTIREFSKHLRQCQEYPHGRDICPAPGSDACFPYAGGKIANTDYMFLEIQLQIIDAINNGEDPAEIKMFQSFGEADTIDDPKKAQDHACERRELFLKREEERKKSREDCEDCEEEEEEAEEEEEIVSEASSDSDTS